MSAVEDILRIDARLKAIEATEQREQAPGWLIWCGRIGSAFVHHGIGEEGAGAWCPQVASGRVLLCCLAGDAQVQQGKTFSVPAGQYLALDTVMSKQFSLRPKSHCELLLIQCS